MALAIIRNPTMTISRADFGRSFVDGILRIVFRVGGRDGQKSSSTLAAGGTAEISAKFPCGSSAILRFIPYASPHLLATIEQAAWEPALTGRRNSP